jgi:hypothetical protein
MVKLLPTPGSLATRIRPPWVSMIALTILNPRPLPSLLRTAAAR